MSVYQLTYAHLMTVRPTRLLNDKDGNLYPDWPSRKKEVVNEFLCLKETLQNTAHVFILIITIKQWETWRKTCLKYGYDEYTLFEMPYFVHNHNYTVEKGFTEANHGGRKLRLVILKGKGTSE